MSKLDEYENLIKSDYLKYYDLYLEGTTVLQEELGCSLGQVSWISKRMGWTRNPEVRRDRIEHNARKRYNNWLLDLNSSDVWYFLGYFTGDGCLQSHRYRVNVVSKDSEPISTFASRFNCKLNRNSGYYSIDMDYPSLCEELMTLGFVDRKSTNGTDLVVPEEFDGPYLRGLMDSDGSVYIHSNGYGNNYIRVTFIGHEKDMLRVCSICSREGIEYVYKYMANRHLWLVSVNKKESVSKLYKLLYSEGDLYIKRKHDKFLELNKSKGEQEER